MKELTNSFKKTGTLHHAYFLVGGGVDVLDELTTFLEKNLKIKTSGNPDFWHGEFSNLSIDDARFISEMQSKKGISGGKKIFIIGAEFISIEAQNSLLKVFEEPTVDTHFFIISSQNNLLPTLASRLQIIELKNSDDNKHKSIINMKMKERIDFVKEIVDRISDEEKTKQDAIDLVNRIEKEIYKEGVDKKRRELNVCELARRSLYDRGAPVKMILENLVLSI